jgi:uncharacterized protein YgbK (DUF1537 family)
MPPGELSLCIVADDLSGAADCAAAFAGACGPVAVVLGDVPARSGRMAMDTDSRAMDPAAAVAVVARAFERIARGGWVPGLVYKKIDSTLRGHVAAELRAALDAAPQFSLAVVAPSFPEQGRTLSGGKLCLNGRPADESRQVVDLMGMLAAAGLRPALLRQPMADPAQVQGLIARAIAGDARAVVVDAASPDDLAQLAYALFAPAAAPVLVAGSAGLARALARHFAPTAASAVGQEADWLPGGPVLALVGSFSRASASQVRQLEACGAAQVIRLDAAQWLDEQRGPERRQAVDSAHEALRSGRNLVLAIAGQVVQPFSRALVRAMARTAAPLLRHAGTCVLTGGDTARALFDELGMSELEVTGEFEPGISVARVAAPAAPGFVLKAGGFGDAQALQRMIAHFGGRRRPTLARESASS